MTAERTSDNRYVTKDALEDILNGCTALHGFQRRSIMNGCFPPPEPRTFYVEIDVTGDPSFVNQIPFKTSNTMIKVIEVIE